MENEPGFRQGKRRQISGPDGVEAWRVAFAACFINFIMAGLGRTSGILYVEVIDIFHTDRKKASLPFTIRSLTRNLLGPVVGILGQKYGVRPIIIVGGIIGTLSAAACFFVEDIFWLTIVWGGLNGAAAAMITTLTQAAIGEHFVKHKSTASGMGFSGGCVAAFVFPAILDVLLHEYNLGGTFLFIAGIIMHVIPAAIIMKKPSWRDRGNKRQNKTDRQELCKLSTEHESEGRAFQITLHGELADDFVMKEEVTDTKRNCETNCADNQCNYRPINTNILWINRQLVIRLLTKDFSLKIPVPKVSQTERTVNNPIVKELEDLFCKIVEDVFQNDTTSEKNAISYNFAAINSTTDFQNNSPRPHYENGSASLSSSDVTAFKSNPMECLLYLLEDFSDTTNRNDIVNLFSEADYDNLSKVLDELDYIHNILQNIKQNISYKSDNTENRAEQTNTFCSLIKTAIKLHTKPLFLLICLCRSSHFLTLMPIVTTVVDFTRDKGLPEVYGKYAIAALSGGDLIGRLFTGWITDRQFLSLPRYMLIFMVLQGISTAILSVMNSAAALLLALVVYGLLQGCVFIQHPVLVSCYLKSDEQSIALGCLNFFSGILSFALPFYIGYFRDSMGSYNGMFYINGFIGSFIGLLWILEPYLLRMDQQSQSRCDTGEQA